MLSLELENVTVHFGKEQILNGVSASFSEGTINSVIGINGVGKSVLMKSIAGLISHGGKVILRDCGQKYGKKEIAYVPQMAYATSSLTAIEMVLLGKVRDLGWKVDQDVLTEVDDIMKRLNISHLAQQKFSELSGGQKQMVIMAQSLLSQPKVLLLDEPTSALDLYHQLQLLDVTRDYCVKNHAIALVVMHDLSLVSRFSDTILLMQQGKQRCQGTPEEVLQAHILEPVYRVEIDVSKSTRGFTTVIPVRTLPEDFEIK